MAVLEQAGRKPDFKKDVETFGKLAEDDFVRNFHNNPNNKNKTLFDVRGVLEYQQSDIDFIIDSLGRKELPQFQDVMSDERCKKIEVKYNSRALDTGWITFEVFSHKNAGWGLFTKCDLMYMVFTEKYTSNIIKRAWIFMDKWKKYASNRQTKAKANWIDNEKVFDILHELKDMEKNGIIKFID